jgi:hypothetical protein
VEKAGWHLKDDTELKTLIKNLMRDLRQCHSTYEVMQAAMGPEKSYQELQKCYREHWFENVKSKGGSENQALFVKKDGFRYFPGTYRGCENKATRYNRLPRKENATEKAFLQEKVPGERKTQKIHQ